MEWRISNYSMHSSARSALRRTANISATLNENGTVVHFGGIHNLTFGNRDAARSKIYDKVAGTLSGAGFDAAESANIIQDMWEKWTFIATLAGVTTLMRATIGDVVSAGGIAVTMSLLTECQAIAVKSGYSPNPDAMRRWREMFSDTGSTLAASMLRDIVDNRPIEGDQIIGDLLIRAGTDLDVPTLRTVFTHLKCYEAQRSRRAAVR